eukprot:TRINITY_DN38688_c0_g1_i1.p1 TRINITY_DN38688_c0_g1~~TRINITY_DN38688_c0_g1_i1.p1  ORF type:complete len:656 (+),score=234.51 TRINITY_DN38688_c0_g1_i1:141-2108(+)
MCIRDRYQRRVRGPTVLFAMSGRTSPQRGGARLGDIQEILKRLKTEVSDLRNQVKEAGSTYFHQFAAQLHLYEGALSGLTETLALVTNCMRNGDGEGIPANAGVVKVLEKRSATGDIEEDVGKSLRSLAHELHDAKLAYHSFSVAAKDIVNDADKMDIVVKACQAEFIKLKLTTNTIKARLNAHRLKLISKGRAFHEWAEMVHFETIECLRREMEEIEADAAAWREEHGAAWAKAQEDWDALMTGNRRIKVAIMLKKMKNSRASCAFSTWSEAIWAIKQARAQAERDLLLAEYQSRFAHLSKEQIEAKLRQFILRWQNAKKMPAFRSWVDLVRHNKAARFAAEHAAELEAMRARLNDMHANSALQKLKLYFQRKLQGVRFQTFRALTVHANQCKARALLDGEAGKRIKAFLKAKLASIGRQCWQAWLQHHDNIAAENIKNNENAKKVGIMLEKIARGLVHRIFNAFGRNHQMASEERAASDALCAKLSLMDDLNKAKLRVFLDSKRLGKMSTLYKHWSNVTANRGANEMLAEIEREDELMRLLKQRLADAESALAGQGLHASGLQRTLREIQDAHAAELKRHEALNGDIQSYERKAQETASMAQHERNSRQGILTEISGLEGDLNAIYRDCDELKSELAGIGAEVGYVHEESYHA